MMAMSAAEPAPSRRDLLYAEIEALPPHLKGQIIDGELIVQPRPAMRHADVATKLTAVLVMRYSLDETGPGGWKIVFEPELHLADDVLIPDIAGWRLADGGDGLLQYTAVPYAPAWLCEVLSPSTARLDRARKLAIYGREGVAHVWLLDPQTRLVEAFTRTESGWTVQIVDTTTAEAAELRVAPFDDVPLNLRRLWDDLPPVEPEAASKAETAAEAEAEDSDGPSTDERAAEEEPPEAAT